MIEIIPSILSTTLKDAQRKLDLCEGQVDKVHLDIMDGSFVKNTSFPIDEVSQLRSACKMRVHLMVSDPLDYASHLVGKVDTVFIHREITHSFEEVLEKLNKHFHVGVVLNMETPAREIFGYLDKISHVLLMTVTTGYGGGEFNEAPLKKSLHLKTLKPSLGIGVDGGVNPKTACIIKKYPVNFVTPGSALFSKGDFYQALLDLRRALG